MSSRHSLTIYRGPSVYDPTTTIRAVLTFESQNRKTGPMAQLWIMVDDDTPTAVARWGRDRAVCGMCPFRPTLQGGCYVDLSRAPLSAWKGSTDSRLAGAAEVRAALRGDPIRLGAYGDPAALPLHVIQFLARAAGHRLTGYTHGWRSRPDLAPYCMASVHSESEAREAHAAGWRTFRGTSPGAPNLPSEITCPSETRGTLCIDCQLCKGNVTTARSITIPVHGAAVRRALTVVQ